MFSNLLLTLGLFVASIGASFAQSDTINQVDDNGKKQGYWVVYGKDRPEAGFPLEGIIEEGTYVDGRKNGVWTKYYKDGKTPKLSGNYINNRPNGKYRKYYEDSSIREEGTYAHNRYVGTLKRFHPNGRLKYMGKYNEEGKEYDTALYFLDDGSLEFMYTYRFDGDPMTSDIYSIDSSNTVTEQHENDVRVVGDKPVDLSGKPKESSKVKKKRTMVSARYSNDYLRETYSDFALCSNDEGENTKKYNKNQEIIFYGNCLDGKVWEGKMYFYDDDGILLFVEVWKRGAYYSEGQL